MTDSERMPPDHDVIQFGADPPIGNADGVAITPFVQVAAVMERNPLEDISIELNTLVKAVLDSDSNRPVGTVTLTLTVERSAKILGAVNITPEIKTKLPKEPKYGALLFADSDGVLSTRNPNQGEMFDRPRGV